MTIAGEKGCVCVGVRGHDRLLCCVSQARNLEAAAGRRCVGRNNRI
jgi:hypothetical protein